MKRFLVAGGGGFIGSSLVKALLAQQADVVVIDNWIRGCPEYLSALKIAYHDNLQIITGDLALSPLTELLNHTQVEMPFDEVWHLAANSDIPAGVADAQVDLKDTFMSTYHLLQGMKELDIKILHFASSSAVYGDLGDIPLHEKIGPLLPISNYGAMKLASEALISAASEAYLARANIFRFPNVVGIPATHGVILDFIKKLVITPNTLDVLGNGTQQKSYLHVSDLVDAMLHIRALPSHLKIELFNIGPVDEGVTVRWIAEQVVARINPIAKIAFGLGNKGWVGDVPKFTYSTEKLSLTAWSPKLNSMAAVKRAIDEIATQQGY